MIRLITVINADDDCTLDDTQPMVPVRADVLEPEYPYREYSAQTLERLYFMMMEVINVMLNDGAPLASVAWRLWAEMDAIDLETRRRKGKRP